MRLSVSLYQKTNNKKLNLKNINLFCLTFDAKVLATNVVNFNILMI